MRERLYADVEGTCTGSDGYIVAVIGISAIGHGTIEPGSGQATFEVSYSAIVYRPFKGEVLDGSVVSVSKVRLPIARRAHRRRWASSPKSVPCRSSSPRTSVDGCLDAAHAAARARGSQIRSDGQPSMLQPARRRDRDDPEGRPRAHQDRRHANRRD